MNTKLKFGLITAVVVGVLGWLAAAGINETATYYVTIEELRAMDDAVDKRLRVAGDVEPGSIVRKEGRVEFTIAQEDQKLDVVYTGRDPLPDTFRDRAEALCDGRLGENNVFVAQKIQAKCASKYEKKPGQEGAPVYESKPEGRQVTQLQ